MLFVEHRCWLSMFFLALIVLKNGDSVRAPLDEILFANHCGHSYDDVVNPMVFSALERSQNHSVLGYHLGGVVCEAVSAEGYDIVVVAGWLSDSKPIVWAGQNAHAQFVLMNSAVQLEMERTPSFRPIIEMMHDQHYQLETLVVENLLITFLAEYELAFLAGALAGLESETKVVAMLAGPPLLVQKMLLLGFHRGVQYTCPSCTFHGMFYTTIQRSEESIYRVVQMWVQERGVDILFSTAERNGYTALRTAAQFGARVIGYEMDAYQVVFSDGELSEGVNLMATALKHLGNVAVHTVRELIRGVPAADLIWQFSRDFPPSLPPMELLHRPDSYAGYSERTKDTLKQLMAQLASPEGLDPLFPFAADRSRFQLDMDLFVPEPPANSWTRVLGLRTPFDLQFSASTCLLTPLRLYSDETLFIFGGGGSDGSPATMWQFNWRTQLWSDMVPALISGTPPEPRNGHAMTSVDGKRLVVFGGILANNGSAVNDLHAFALPLTPYGAPESTWSRLRGVSGLPWPVSRSSHTLVSFVDYCLKLSEDPSPSSALLFGGRTEAGATQADLWRLDVDWGASEASWQSLTPQSGMGAGVVGHAAVMVNGTMYVHGGNRSTTEWGNTSPLAELWAYSVVGDSWTQLPSGPNPRWGHSVHVVGVEVGAGSTAGTEFFLVCVSGEGVNGPLGVDAYSLDTGSWVTSDQLTGVGLMSRPGYPSMRVGSRVLVVGGASADGAAGEVETWVLHFAKLEVSNDGKDFLFGQSPLIVTAATATFVLLVVGVLALLSYRRKVRREVSRLVRQVDFTDEQKQVIKQVMSDPSGIFKRVTLSREDVTVVRRIGVGAYGDVWTGRWHGVDCAVKRFLGEQLDDTSMRQFRVEMELHMKLRHVNVIGFIGGCWEPPIVMLVLELAEGGPLSGRLTNTELPPLTWAEKKLEIATGIAAGMMYLHTRSPSVIHRDLKSANVLLDFQMVAKVADFGVSTENVHEINDTHTIVGSQYWLAPEVTRGEAYDESCDVYGFAIVLCEMAVRGGHVADLFPGLSSSGLSLKIARGWRPDLALLDTDLGDVPGLMSLVEACWQHVPANRPKFEELFDALKALLEGGGEEGDLFSWMLLPHHGAHNDDSSATGSPVSLISDDQKKQKLTKEAQQEVVMERVVELRTRRARLQESMAAVEEENAVLRNALCLHSP